MEVRSAGRHCASCDRTLLDLRGLTRARAEARVHRADGPVCALAYVDQRTREIWYPPAAEPAPRLGGVVLAAALTVSACSEPAPRDAGAEVRDAGAAMTPLGPPGACAAPDAPRSRPVPSDELAWPPGSPVPTDEQRALTERKHPPPPVVLPPYVLEDPGFVK